MANLWVKSWQPLLGIFFQIYKSSAKKKLYNIDKICKMQRAQTFDYRSSKPEKSLQRAATDRDIKFEAQNSEQSVALAVAVKKGAEYPLRWALQTLHLVGGRILVIYITRIVKTVPTAMGPVHISQANPAHIQAYMAEIERKTSQWLRSLEDVCQHYKIVPEFSVIKSDEPVHQLLLAQIGDRRINHLVLGSSSSSLLRFTRSTSDIVLKNTPKYCSVTIAPRHYKAVLNKRLGDSFSSQTSNVSSDELSVDDNSTTNGDKSDEDGMPKVLVSTHELASTTLTTTCEPNEIEDLKLQASEILKKAEKITKQHIEARKLNDEVIQVTKIAKEQAEAQAELLRKERDDAEARWEAGEEKRKLLEKEISRLKEIECNPKMETRRLNSKYVNYTLDEIRNATNDFSPNAKLSESHSSTIYKARLHYTDVAIKCLKDNVVHGYEEFQNEVEMLISLQHPHMLRVLGSCLENHAIVYEYVPNGTLQDYLFSTPSHPNLPWYIRFRIAYEVSSAVYFLHTRKPQPVVHQQVHPRKILLDKNYGSKLSIGSHNQFLKAYCMHESEHQDQVVPIPTSDVYCLGILMLQLLTGKVDDDNNLWKNVERAVDQGSLCDILDSSAGEWPFVETLQMACLALKCSISSSNDRPTLEPDILNMLEKIKESGDAHVDNYSSRLQEQNTLESLCAPSQYICPIEQDIMEHPVIAQDGFTYEYEAIKGWLQEHDTSPMTNLKLERKDLIPNHALRSAIEEWKLTHT